LRATATRRSTCPARSPGRVCDADALPGTSGDELGAFLVLLVAFVAATGAVATWRFNAYRRAL
jgi:hypothetical protein